MKSRADARLFQLCSNCKYYGSFNSTASEYNASFISLDLTATEAQIVPLPPKALNCCFWRVERVFKSHLIVTAPPLLVAAGTTLPPVFTPAFTVSAAPALADRASGL